MPTGYCGLGQSVKALIGTLSTPVELDVVVGSGLYPLLYRHVLLYHTYRVLSVHLSGRSTTTCSQRFTMLVWAIPFESMRSGLPGIGASVTRL